MSETFEELTERLSSGFKKADPPQAAELEANKKRMANLKVAELRNAWNAPMRHFKCASKTDNEWGRMLARILPMLGSGCLVGLIGTRGNGKTQMAVELMSEATRNLKTAYFTSAVGFFMEIKATYKSDSKASEDDVISSRVKPSLLVIDEIGKRGGSEWENNLLFELVNRRYNAMKDTLLIDNRSKQEFIDTIGPSLASRMNDGGGIIECTWESFRK